MHWKERFYRPRDTSNDIFAYLNKETGVAYPSNEFHIRKCRGEDMTGFVAVRNKEVTPEFTKQVLENLGRTIEKARSKMTEPSPSTDPEPPHNPSTQSPSPEV